MLEFGLVDKRRQFKSLGKYNSEFSGTFFNATKKLMDWKIWIACLVFAIQENHEMVKTKGVTDKRSHDMVKKAGDEFNATTDRNNRFTPWLLRLGILKTSGV